MPEKLISNRGGRGSTVAPPPPPLARSYATGGDYRFDKSRLHIYMSGIYIYPVAFAATRCADRPSWTLVVYCKRVHYMVCEIISVVDACAMASVSTGCRV